MNGLFEDFTAIGGAVGLLAFYCLIGFLAVRRHWIGDRGILRVAGLQINVIVPLTIFTSVLRTFDIRDPEKLLLLPAWGAWALFFAGISLVGTIGASRLAGRRLRGNSVLFVLTLISNAIFIPTPILLAVAPPGEGDRALFIMSTYVIFLQTATWTIGVWCLGGKLDDTRQLIRRLVNPPMISIVLGYGIAAIPPLRDAIHPQSALWDVPAFARYLVGPVGMIILGFLLATSRPTWRGHRLDIVAVCALRGFIVPAATILALAWLRVEWLFGLVVIVEASTPPATNLSVIAAYYRGPVDRIISTYIPSYLLTAITLPIWMLVYMQITK